MHTIDDLPKNNPDTNISISFAHFFPVYQWHNTKDGSGINTQRMLSRMNMDTERVADDDWMLYVDFGMNYDNVLIQHCRFGYQVTGCTEYMLYAHGMFTMAFTNAVREYQVFLERYGAENGIVHVPPAPVLTEKIYEALIPHFISDAEQRGFITFEEPTMLAPCLQLIPDDNHRFLFTTMYQMIIQLFYNLSFDNNNNIAYINKVIPIGRVRTIMDKCLLLYKNSRVELNTKDTVNLLVMIEMCMQCTIGQIWYKLKDEIPSFTGMDEKRFLRLGQAFIKQVVTDMGSPRITNLEDPTDWNSLLG